MALTRKIIDIPRDYLIVIVEAGHVLMAMRRYDEALEVFEGVCHLAPKSEVPLIGIGNVHSARHEFDEALKAYRKALKVEPKSALIHALMGEVYLLQDKKDKGLEYVNKALELDHEGKPGRFAQSLLDAVAQGALPLKDLLESENLPKPPPTNITRKES